MAHQTPGLPPRSFYFYWVRGPVGPQPNIASREAFEDIVGEQERKIMLGQPYKITEPFLTMDELIARYPAPEARGHATP